MLHVCVCVCVLCILHHCVHGEVHASDVHRSETDAGVFFSNFPLYFGLSLNPELTDLALLASQLVSSRNLSFSTFPGWGCMLYLPSV